MPKVLITGINGFVGQHLTRELTRQGHQVDGLIHGSKLAPDIRGSVAKYTVCDIADRRAVFQLDLSSYDVIVNLAGLASYGKSFAAPKHYMEVNADAVKNICLRMSDQASKSRLLTISSGVVYDPRQSLPFYETSKTANQASPYTASKLHMEQIVTSYINKGLDCLIIRPFNHIGPGQSAGFLVHDLCQQLLQVAAGAKDSVIVGNLASRRDYSDVRDVVKAYAQLAFAKPKILTSHVYNVCSGVSQSGQAILEELQKHIPGSQQAHLVVDSKLLRPDDPEELRGSHDLLSKDIGWQPKVPFEQTLEDIVHSIS
ncbi:MAG TPA: GDP-mannose 4,6-dehydratase [Candidatus Saccharimonadales bacterium]|nr:GDP-mannose 4,6-dehydratase [Candidatus Saccharimonadales bacterium]